MPITQTATRVIPHSIAETPSASSLEQKPDGAARGEENAAWKDGVHYELKAEQQPRATRSFRQTLKRVTTIRRTTTPMPDKTEQKRAFSGKKAEALDFQKTVLQAVKGFLKAKEGDHGAFVSLRGKVEQQLVRIEEELNTGANQPVSLEDVKVAKAMSKELKADIANALRLETGINEKDAAKQAKRVFNEYFVSTINNMEWATISKSFRIGTEKLTSTLTPAAQMRLGGENSCDIFARSYDGKGVCAGSTTETKHAANLWFSELKAESGEVLFKGIRHGILSPYGLKEGSVERQAGADTRVKELLTAALFMDISKMERALAGEVVPMRLTSTSLVTASKIGGLNNEGAMFDDQFAALSKASGKTLSLTVTTADGSQRDVTVKPEVLPFSVGVNVVALSVPLDAVSGWKGADKINRQSLEVLLGPLEGEDLQGWAGAYLFENPDADNAARVTTLASQIKEIWERKSHHSDGQDPYKLAQRIALLTHEVGAVPAWNCKSGKDRTGWLDVEIKSAAIMAHQAAIDNNGEAKAHPAPGAAADRHKQVISNVALRDGNLELQKTNTGVKGNKIFNGTAADHTALSFYNRVSDQRIATQIKGLSTLYGA